MFDENTSAGAYQNGYQPVLTPKIPSVILPISAGSDLVGGIYLSTKKSMKT